MPACCWRSITTSPSPVAPLRGEYIKALQLDVLDGRIESGQDFDRVARLDEVANGYRAMNDREAIKSMVEISR